MQATDAESETFHIALYLQNKMYNKQLNQNDWKGKRKEMWQAKHITCED